MKVSVNKSSMTEAEGSWRKIQFSMTPLIFLLRCLRGSGQSFSRVMAKTNAWNNSVFWTLLTRTRMVRL